MLSSMNSGFNSCTKLAVPVRVFYYPGMGMLQAYSFCALYFRVFLFSCLCCLLPAGALCSDADPVWQELEAGLQFASFASSQAESAANIDIVRIDPALFRFSLHSAGAEGPASHSLLGWAEQEDLVLAINASMYLPDRVTSTGYLRYGDHVNNPRIHNKFGAFFVAEPDMPDLPQAAILDRERDTWAEQLPRYMLVIQNYRLIDTDGKVLWLPGGAEHSIAAVGQDRQGHILFIHCRDPMTGEAFAAALLRMPLVLRSLMYVEGGSQAAMLVRCPKLRRLWIGQSSMLFLHPPENGNTLPNVLGVRRRAAK
ncbi:MAG: phosphodiester glycosidase family protein [Desulfovibrionaceae bacterium]|nr:phosphodiester glycosidase family protein [Desulfovibrionaceae bacterium]